MLRFLLLLGLLISLNSFGQNKPYVSAGAGISGGMFGYGGEAGLYNDKWWYALSIDRTPSTKESFVGAKVYRKLFGIDKVDHYLNMAVKVQTKECYVVAEPGLAIVVNATKKFAPQLTLSTPIVKSYMYFAVGVGVNYWIK